MTTYGPGYRQIHIMVSVTNINICMA